jgi:hypothetical protein
MQDKNSIGVVCCANTAKECLEHTKWSFIQAGMDTEILLDNQHYPEKQS